MISLIAATICLISCHGGPAEHFSVFAKKLEERGYEVQLYAGGPGASKFRERGLSLTMEFDPEDEKVAVEIARRCSQAEGVMTDVGHSFDKALQQALAKEVPHVLRLAYYDNPEAYVPGAYPTLAEEVMRLADKVVFANANLAESPVFQAMKERIGLGYYPLLQAEKIAARREDEHDTKRRDFFSRHRLEDKGEKIFVYFGGNNEDYFTQAFPLFLKLLSQSMEEKNLSGFLIVLQQHPGAKNKNIDRLQLESWIEKQGREAHAPSIFFSDEKVDDSLVLADGALYYQTSMGPLFMLAGIPVMQVGHYEDILIREHLCPSVTTSAEFVEAIDSLTPTALSEEKQKRIFKALGIKENWLEELIHAFFKVSFSP